MIERADSVFWSLFAIVVNQFMSIMQSEGLMSSMYEIRLLTGITMPYGLYYEL